MSAVIFFRSSAAAETVLSGPPPDAQRTAKTTPPIRNRPDATSKSRRSLLANLRPDWNRMQAVHLEGDPEGRDGDQGVRQIDQHVRDQAYGLQVGEEVHHHIDRIPDAEDVEVNARRFRRM